MRNSSIFIADFSIQWDINISVSPIKWQQQSTDKSHILQLCKLILIFTQTNKSACSHLFFFICLNQISSTNIKSFFGNKSCGCLCNFSCISSIHVYSSNLATNEKITSSRTVFLSSKSNVTILSLSFFLVFHTRVFLLSTFGLFIILHLQSTNISSRLLTGGYLPIWEVAKYLSCFCYRTFITYVISIVCRILLYVLFQIWN